MRDVTATPDRDVETSGLTEVGQFSIQATGKAFNILINGLYSNKPLAVVRELASNAIDSHAVFGNPERPFKLQLPTRWDPTFSVRDYGISLSHKDVMGLYTTVFASTKGDDNTTVGKFGLGSKVPFAYTDSFTVTAILDGEKRTYNAFMDAKGIPTIALFAREETDEERGLEITFPVKEQDVNAFCEAAKRVVFGLPLAPECNVQDLVSLTTVEPILKGTNWALYPRQNTYGLNAFVVRQGCVLYPVDTSALSDASHLARTTLETLRGEPLVVDMPIGSVDITPSRESLQYDPITVKNLSDAVEGILSVFLAQANDAVASAPTLFEAIKKRGAVLEGFSNYRLRDLLSQKLTWKGRHLQSSIQFVTGTASAKRRGLDIAMFYSEGRRGKRKYNIHHGVLKIEPAASNQPTFAYYEGSTPTYLNARLAAAPGHVLLRGFKPGSKAHTLLWHLMGRPAAALEFVNLDTIEFYKPDYQKSIVDVKQWNDNSDCFADRPHHGVDIADTNTNVYYVHTYKGSPKTAAGQETSTGRLARQWDPLTQNKLLGDSPVLVGIPASRKDIAKALPPHWKEFWSAAKEAVLANYDATVAAKEEAVSTMRGNTSVQRKLTFVKSLTRIAGNITDPESTALRVQREIAPYGEDVANGGLQTVLKNLLDLVLTADEKAALPPAPDAKAYGDAFWALIRDHNTAYPMLASVQRAGSHPYHNQEPTELDFENYTAYINLMDSVIAAKQAAEKAAEIDAAQLVDDKTAPDAVFSVDFSKAA